MTSAIPMNDFHKDFHIFTVIDLSPHGCITNQHKNQLPVGLLAHLIEHYIYIAGGPEFKSYTGLNFLEALFFTGHIFTTALSNVCYCKDRFHIHKASLLSKELLGTIHFFKIT